jgi:tRNA threonylcarbamoyladenosine biosynthesis protein TsaE
MAGLYTTPSMDRLVDGADAMWALGQALGRAAAAGDTIALTGDLGAGKTVLVQGLAAGLGFDGPVTSPTFTLIHLLQGGRLPLAHADLYRLDRLEELEAIGLEEHLGGDGVAAVEWADKLPGVMPADTLWLHLEVTGEQTRRVTFRTAGPRAAALLAAALAAWERDQVSG